MRTTEFKDTELGPIPKDWEVKRLGEVCDVLDNRRVPLNDSQRRAGPYPYCGANGIVDYIDEYEFDEDVILIAEDGGNFGDYKTRPIAYRMGGKFWVNNHAHVLQTRENGCQNYVFSQLEHKDITDLISGGTRAKLTRGQLERIAIPLPSLPEQRRIAAALGDVDKLIENLKKRVEKKKNLKRGAMQELLTGKRRLKGFTGAWVEKRLGEIGAFSKGVGINRTESNTGDLPAVRYGEIYTHHNDCVRRYISRISKEVAEKAHLTKRGDILFAGSGETEEDIGKSVSVLDDGVYAGGDLIIFSPSEPTEPIFWGYLLNLPYVQRQKTLLAQGGTVVHIRAASIASIKVQFPPLPEQRAIAAVLSDMDAEIANLEHKLKKMTLLKQGMMQDLLTGKVRLV